jgi:glycosyltransferase involved in cell wall biosynthesis
MRILFLSAQLPEPPHAGGTLRINGLMRGLHGAGHGVCLLAFADGDQLASVREKLDEFVSQISIVRPPHRSVRQRLRNLVFSNLADMERRYYSPLFERTLEGLLATHSFDLIQIESLEMAVYLPIIQRLQPATPVIYDSFNAEYALQRTIFETESRRLQRLPGALYSFIQWRRLTRFERSVCHAVDHTIAVSDADADAFARLAPNRPVSVIPNGINVACYSATDSSLELGQHALVFTGSMGYRPNVDGALWFADQVLPRIRAHVPDAKFFVVGSNPHSRLTVLRDRDDVEVTGWVPNVNPFLHAAAVYVIPLRMGSGTRLKVLQAMAAGRAVVSTTIGAQGLDAQDGEQLRLADTADEFAQAVVALLNAPDQRRALGQAGMAFVQAHFDWPAIVPGLLRVYDEITGGKATEAR